MSQFEENLKNQKKSWGEVSDRATRAHLSIFPFEKPKRVFLMGQGSSHFVAQLAAWSLNRIESAMDRIPVYASSVSHILEQFRFQPDDWVIGISHRGRTRQVHEILQRADSTGAFTGLISGVGVDSPDYIGVHLDTVEQETIEPHTISMTSALCAATVIVGGARIGDLWKEQAEVEDPKLKDLKAKVGKGPQVLLGEGVGEWIAREASLKLMETAKLPIRCFGSDEYFHGPRFSKQKGEVYWHLKTKEDPRADDIRSAYSVEVSTEHPLSFIPALVESQWATLAVAQNLGLDPDFKGEDH